MEGILGIAASRTSERETPARDFSSLPGEMTYMFRNKYVVLAHIDGGDSIHYTKS